MNTVFELVNFGNEAVAIEWRIKHREVDMTYRGLLTARRNLDNARRLMDEKAEQLKAVGQLATMINFFAVSAICEIEIHDETSSEMVVIFGLLSALVVSGMHTRTYTPIVS